jgi:hypothetical protein
MTISSDPGHGSSPAAWITVVIMLVAITLGTLAFWVDIPWLVFASVGLLILGAVVGLVLRKAGYGVGGSKLTNSKLAEKVHS